MKVFAFDRDQTVDTSQGPVPLEWVKQLAHETEHEVWAIGNQTLKEEADIPGLEEYGARGMTREDRVMKLKEEFPDAEEYIVIDDVDLSDLESWTYYSPEEFVEKFDIEELVSSS